MTKTEISHIIEQYFISLMVDRTDTTIKLEAINFIVPLIETDKDIIKDILIEVTHRGFCLKLLYKNSFPCRNTTCSQCAISLINEMLYSWNKNE